jgi:prolyl 3-hydroxylase /prolyl 3,4-dihydroxylase
MDQVGSDGESAEDGMSEDDQEDDSGPLLTVQPGFNRLLLVLRDERVMHFVKYLSASAPGCRWDVCGEWEVGMIEEKHSDSD